MKHYGTLILFDPSTDFAWLDGSSPMKDHSKIIYSNVSVCISLEKARVGALEKLTCARKLNRLAVDS
jgi:hypothetical protein